MKKLVSVLLALCLACMLVSAVAEESAEPEFSVVGTWIADRLVAGETVYDAEALKALEASMTLELREDGTFTDEEILAGDISVYNGTWTMAENTITLVPDDGETSTVVLENEELVIDTGVSAIYLVKAAGGIALFNGEYIVTGVSIMGMTMSLADLGMDTTVTLTVKDGNGHLVSTYANGYVWEEDVTTELQDGKLITSPITMGAGMGNLTMEISRQEDGSLFAVTKIPYSGTELDATFILVPADQAQQEPAA